MTDTAGWPGGVAGLRGQPLIVSRVMRDPATNGLLASRVAVIKECLTEPVVTRHSGNPVGRLTA